MDSGHFIPPAFRTRIVGTFRAAGQQWLEDLPDTLSRYASRWKLSGIAPVEGLSYGWVAYCTSPYGPAVLKLSVPNPEAVTEILALQRFPDDIACGVLEADPESGAVLLERVSPGEELRRIDDFATRVAVAAEVFARLHARHRTSHTPTPSCAGAGHRSPPRQSGLAPFPRYADQAIAAFRDAEAVVQPNRHRSVARMIDAGKEALSALLRITGADSDQGNPNTGTGTEVLLHGDLHHDNILRAGAGWKLIDPKGTLGPVALEPARFIINQLEDADQAVRREQFETMSNAFAEALSSLPTAAAPSAIPPRAVATAAVLDGAVSTSWSIDEGIEDSEIETKAKRVVETAEWACDL